MFQYRVAGCKNFSFCLALILILIAPISVSAQTSGCNGAHLAAHLQTIC